MNSSFQTDGLSPLSSGSSERAHLQAPRLFSQIKATPGFVMGNRAFMRAWAARRAAIAVGAARATAFSGNGSDHRSNLAPNDGAEASVTSSRTACP